MAIRNRRGLKKDLDPAKLLSGEFAFPTDTGEVYYCVAPGDVKRVATKEELQEILTSSPDAYQALLQLINNLEDNPSELTNILNNIANLQDNVGDLSLLATETKTNLVSAINEIMIGKFNISDLVHTDTISDAKKAPSSVVTEALGREIDEINNNLNALSGLNIVSNIAVDVSSVGDITAWYNGLTQGITMQYLSPSISISLFGSTTFLAIASFRSTQYGSILALSPNGLFYNRIDNGTWAGWKTTTLS